MVPLRRLPPHTFAVGVHRLTLRMVITNDFLERGTFRDRMRGQPSGHYGGFDTAGIETRGGPVARNGQIVERHIERALAIRNATRQRLYIPIRRIDVRCPELLGEA